MLYTNCWNKTLLNSSQCCGKAGQSLGLYSWQQHQDTVNQWGVSMSYTMTAEQHACILQNLRAYLLTEFSCQRKHGIYLFEPGGRTAQWLWSAHSPSTWVLRSRKEISHMPTKPGEDSSNLLEEKDMKPPLWAVGVRKQRTLPTYIITNSPWCSSSTWKRSSSHMAWESSSKGELMGDTQGRIDPSCIPE